MSPGLLPDLRAHKGNFKLCIIIWLVLGAATCSKGNESPANSIAQTDCPACPTCPACQCQCECKFSLEQACKPSSDTEAPSETEDSVTSLKTLAEVALPTPSPEAPPTGKPGRAHSQPPPVYRRGFIMVLWYTLETRQLPIGSDPGPHLAPLIQILALLRHCSSGGSAGAWLGWSVWASILAVIVTSCSAVQDLMPDYSLKGVRACHTSTLAAGFNSQTGNCCGAMTLTRLTSATLRCKWAPAAR